MAIYSKYSFYEGVGGLASLSHGNMGFSETHCLSDTFASGAGGSTETYSHDYKEEPGLKLQCKTGYISKLVDFGITTSTEDQQMCTRKNNSQFCNKFIDDSTFKAFIRTYCYDEDHCMIKSINKFLMPHSDKLPEAAICYDL